MHQHQHLNIVHFGVVKSVSQPPRTSHVYVTPFQVTLCLNVPLRPRYPTPSPRFVAPRNTPTYIQGILPVNGLWEDCVDQFGAHQQSSTRAVPPGRVAKVGQRSELWIPIQTSGFIVHPVYYHFARNAPWWTLPRSPPRSFASQTQDFCRLSEAFPIGYYPCHVLSLIVALHCLLAGTYHWWPQM